MNTLPNECAPLLCRLFYSSLCRDADTAKSSCRKRDAWEGGWEVRNRAHGGVGGEEGGVVGTAYIAIILVIGVWSQWV